MADGSFRCDCSGLADPVVPAVDEAPTGCEMIGWSFAVAPDTLKSPGCLACQLSAWIQQC